MSEPVHDGQPDGPRVGENAQEHAELAALRSQLAAGEASDGYHTHNELYQFRLLYHAHAVRGWVAAGVPVVKSWRHSDGEPCFGGGWFIVVAQLPTAGQVSNHYPAESWELFQVPEVDRAPFDGHTSADVAARLRLELQQGEPEQVWCCIRCGSRRWVGWRAGPEHEGYPLRAQCVPCGHVQTPPEGGR